MSHEHHILIVDDEGTIREVICQYLQREGYTVSEAETGPQALSMLQGERPDLVLLDIMLPGADGHTIARHLRGDAEHAPTHSDEQIPIIFLSARGSEEDRVAGLKLGADDYVVKPFSPLELLERVKAILRRSHAAKLQRMQPIEHGALQLDPSRRRVTVDGRCIALTTKEFDLLWFLLRHPRQTFTRQQLLVHVWGYGFCGGDSTVTVHVRRLREKIEPDPCQPRFIQTVWGAGYKFDDPDKL